MALAIDELIAEETPDEVLSSMLSIAASLGFPVTSWKPTGVLRTIFVITATKLSGTTKLVALLARLGFLEYSEGAWLRMLAKAVYNVDYIPATYAATTVTLTNASGTAFDAAALSMHITSALGKSFTNTGVVHVNAGGTASIPVRAEVIGSAGTVGAGELTHFATPTIGLTATNPAAAVGTDIERDDDLKQRCRDKLGSLSFAGPPGAYAYAVKSAATSVPITRATVTAVATNGHVRVVVATGGGAPSSGDVAIAATAALAYAPQGVTVDVIAATNHPIAISGDVWIAGGSLTDAQILAAAADALAAHLALRPIGGVIIPPAASGIIDREALVGVLYTLPGAVKATLAAPAADVALLDTEVATIAGAVSLVIHRV
jgi:phage-related baseplate assembly protein